MYFRWVIGDGVKDKEREWDGDFKRRVGNDTLPFQLMTIYIIFPYFIVVENCKEPLTAKRQHHYNSTLFISISERFHIENVRKMFRTHSTRTNEWLCLRQLKEYPDVCELFAFNIAHFRVDILCLINGLCVWYVRSTGMRASEWALTIIAKIYCDKTCVGCAKTILRGTIVSPVPMPTWNPCREKKHFIHPYHCLWLIEMLKTNTSIRMFSSSLSKR